MLSNPHSPRAVFSSGRRIFLFVLAALVAAVLAAVLPATWIVITFVGIVGVLVLGWVFLRPYRALVVFAFLIPLEIYVSPALRVTSNQIFLSLFLIAWFIFLLQHPNQAFFSTPALRPLQAILLGFVIFLALSLLWSIDRTATAKSIFRVVAPLVVFWAIVTIVRKPHQLHAIVTSIGLGCIVVIAYGALQYWRHDYGASYALFSPFYQDLFVSRGGGLSIVSTFASPNMLAAYGLMVLPLIIGKATTARSMQRVFWMLVALALAGVILLTFSKSAWIALGLFGSAWLLVKTRASTKIVLILAATTGMLVLVVFGQQVSGLLLNLFPNSEQVSVFSRLDVWRVAFQAFANSPIWGYGSDAFTAATADLRVGTMAADLIRAHNLYLQTLVDVGLIGFLLYFGAMAWVLKLSVSTYRTANKGPVRDTLLSLLFSLGGFLFYALFDALNGFNSYNNLQWVILGLLVASASMLVSAHTSLPKGTEQNAGPPAHLE